MLSSRLSHTLRRQGVQRPQQGAYVFFFGHGVKLAAFIVRQPVGGLQRAQAFLGQKVGQGVFPHHFQPFGKGVFTGEAQGIGIGFHLGAQRVQLHRPGRIPARQIGVGGKSAAGHAMVAVQGVQPRQRRSRVPAGAAVLTQKNGHGQRIRRTLAHGEAFHPVVEGFFFRGAALRLPPVLPLEGEHVHQAGHVRQLAPHGLHQVQKERLARAAV